MNRPHPLQEHGPHPAPAADPFAPGKAGGPEEANLGDWLINLWEARWTTLVWFVLFLGLGVFYVWHKTPVYQIEALLQVEPKKESPSDPAFSKMQNMFAEPADAQAEIEILRSNQILGRTVETLKLDIEARPVYFPVVGAAMMRDNPAAPAVTVASFDVPPALRGVGFRLTALGDGSFAWTTRSGEILGAGRPGDPLRADLAGFPLQLKVQFLAGKSGQRFDLVRKPMQVAIEELRKDFSASERGKLTNVIGLAYRSHSQAQGTAVLNEIVNQYLRFKAEKRGGEAAQTLAFLQSRMPELKAKLEDSESRLNAFRSQTGSVDLPKEAEDLVTHSAKLNSDISALRQKREDLLRTYQPGADVVVTVNEQIRRLQNEADHVEAKARTLPGTEQTVVRLTRDVTVNQELYTALLNNIQELQLAKAGGQGGYDLVDPANAAMDPMGPKPGMQVAIFGFLGLLVGGGVAKVRRLLRKGVKDHRLIESKLGLPVVVTIPHSQAQDRYAKAIAKRQDGLHLMALGEPDDLATESLRSLRTVLYFAMREAPDNVVMLTGPAPGVGKSFITSNFAALLAQSGAKVLLVDGDLRRGNLHHYFGVKSRQSGLGDVLARRADWEAVVRRTEIPGLDLMTTGLLPPNPSELLMAPPFREFIDRAKAAYQYVIIDAPPVLAVTDPTIIGARAGTVLLVAKFGRHAIDEIRTCQQRLEHAGVRLLGCVFNDVQPTVLGNIGSNYQYAYHYSYKA
ncbi:MAG: polysaccharide biosynthesis tyrosine autokinase [Holophaga sp.]